MRACHTVAPAERLRPPRTGEPAVTSRAVPRRTLRRIVSLATRAPSVHNTQPWRWHAAGSTLELFADHSRQLPVSDPAGRNLVLSCGAVLHHVQVVADALGWPATVDRLPDPGRPDLLARLTLRPGAPSTRAPQLLDAVQQRCTDRRRFTSWPVPDERLAGLATLVRTGGVRALPLTEVTERFRAERLIERANELQDPKALREQEVWVDHGTGDGVPASVLPVGPGAGRRPSRFTSGLLDDKGGREVEGSDGLVVICAGEDEPGTWLSAGEGLSALWLAATTDGLSLVPLSHVVEIPVTREAFRIDVLGGLAHPLLVVRLGWQAISRSQIPPTPRRPVDEVLRID